MVGYTRYVGRGIIEETQWGRRGEVIWGGWGGGEVHSRQREQFEQGQQLGAGGWMWTRQLWWMRQLRLL